MASQVKAMFFKSIFIQRLTPSITEPSIISRSCIQIYIVQAWFYLYTTQTEITSIYVSISVSTDKSLIVLRNLGSVFLHKWFLMVIALLLLHPWGVQYKQLAGKLGRVQNINTNLDHRIMAGCMFKIPYQITGILFDYL